MHVKSEVCAVYRKFCAQVFLLFLVRAIFHLLRLKLLLFFLSFFS